MLHLCRQYGWTLDYTLDLPFKSIGALMRATKRLQCLDRAEELRISLAGGAQNKYIKDLMEHYSKGSQSEKAIKRNKPKSVSTDKAFDALRGML